jgi:hypothetical protein
MADALRFAVAVEDLQGDVMEDPCPEVRSLGVQMKVAVSSCDGALEHILDRLAIA